MNITGDSFDHAFSFSADWDRHYYVAVCCFVVFNLADYAGKQLAVWIQLPGPSKIGQISLSIAAILRCALIPLFMFSNVSVGNRKTEIAFNSDAFYITFMVLLGFTNGYIGNIAMMFGPKCVKNNDHQVCTMYLILEHLVSFSRIRVQLKYYHLQYLSTKFVQKFNLLKDM